MKDKLRSQRLKKYGLIALGIIIAGYLILGINISSKDSTVKDGLGNEFVSSEEASAGTADRDSSITDSLESNAATESEIETVTEEAEKSASADEPSTKTNDKGTDDNDTKTEVKSSDYKKQPSGKSENKKDTKITEDTTPEEIKVDNSGDPTASNEGNVLLKPETPESVTVTIQIRCDTLSSDMTKLENESLREYIPEDGVILKETVYKGTTENTVYDALCYVCRNMDIQFEASFTPLFNSYYIEGINYLYEFDGGPQSGWMFSVNDWFPNYGCSSYYLSDGDNIKWLYTCEGYGQDVGAGSWS